MLLSRFYFDVCLLFASTNLPEENQKNIIFCVSYNYKCLKYLCFMLVWQNKKISGIRCYFADRVLFQYKWRSWTKHLHDILYARLQLVIQIANMWEKMASTREDCNRITMSIKLGAKRWVLRPKFNKNTKSRTLAANNTNKLYFAADDVKVFIKPSTTIDNLFYTAVIFICHPYFVLFLWMVFNVFFANKNEWFIFLWITLIGTINSSTVSIHAKTTF